MKVDVGGADARHLNAVTRAATERFTAVLGRERRIRIRSLAFDGANLSPRDTGYNALDFVQIGINEKVERRLAFLLIVTEVDVSAARLSYFLALPSQLTNVAIVSTRRLAELNSPELDDRALMAERLSTLMLHCFGRLLNLGYRDDPSNYLARVREPAGLDRMSAFTDAQYDEMARTLPDEANDRFSDGGAVGFAVRQTLANLPRITRAALRANPLRIASRLPTTIAAALSVIILLIFGGETWDFAAAVSNVQLGIFVAGCFAGATWVLYRAFSFDLLSGRHGRLAESSVVTAGATSLALVLTLACLFALFAALMYAIIALVFPDALMSTWTSARDGSTVDAHLRLTVFLAAVGVLSGSLGGSADSRAVVRNVLFAGDET